MIFQETPLPGAFLIDLDRIEDERGFFARTRCCREFRVRDLCGDFVQSSISYNKRKGTLRGMHFQVAPHVEVKLVRCTRGSIYDVIVDLRPQSPTFRQWFATELTVENRRALYIPQDFAHGFQTLEDHSEVFYEISEVYSPDCARGIRWNDPAIGIEWPLEVTVISQRDQGYPLLELE